MWLYYLLGCVPAFRGVGSVFFFVRMGLLACVHVFPLTAGLSERRTQHNE